MSTVPPVTTYKLPPPTAQIPRPPADFVPTRGADYHGVMPRAGELAVIEDAVAELKGFAEFSSVFGTTLPHVDILIAIFDGAARWSSSRAMTRAYDAYCHTQEGLVWTDLRDVMARVRPVYEQALAVNPSLAARLSALGRLLGAQQLIAQRAVATRKANKEALARGEPATHGKVGRRKTKAAEKAALAAQGGSDASGVRTVARELIEPSARSPREGE